MSKHDDYTIDHAIASLFILAYTILDYYKTPTDLQLNIESEICGKKIHVMLEVVDDE